VAESARTRPGKAGLPGHNAPVNARTNLDLHALECLDMFVRERSVSRAAERLGMSQSSASEMLARLRERFDDPLLVRGREGMMPTPKALELLPQVRAAIAQLHALIDAGETFSPADSTLRFRLTTSDYTQLLLMPRLCRRLQDQAPRCAIDLLPVHILRVAEALETGEIDLAIAYYPEPPPGLRRSPLFLDEFVCIARAGHPATRSALDGPAFAELAHVSVAPSGLSYFSSAVDAALESQGLHRRIAVSCPHFMLGAHLVAQSDMVLALPRRAATALATLMPLRLIEVPLQLKPLEVAMYWHDRTHHSQPHQWLRSLIRELLDPGGESVEPIRPTPGT
jgi:DNA-binding transcriptional LysR family regulator